jgi:hypothetical protein
MGAGLRSVTKCFGAGAIYPVTNELLEFRERNPSYGNHPVCRYALQRGERRASPLVHCGAR